MYKLRIIRKKDSDGFRQTLIDTLDALGIVEGSEFVISKRKADYTVNELTEQNSVKGKTNTSAIAAKKVFPTSGTKRWEVLAALHVIGKGTRKHLCHVTGMKPDTLRPRVLECIDGGWVQQCLATPYIDDEEVLELTEEGKHELARTF